MINLKKKKKKKGASKGGGQRTRWNNLGVGVSAFSFTLWIWNCGTEVYSILNIAVIPVLEEFRYCTIFLDPYTYIAYILIEKIPPRVIFHL